MASKAELTDLYIRALEATLKCVQRENEALRAEAAMLPVSAYQQPEGFASEFNRLNIQPNLAALAQAIREHRRMSNDSRPAVQANRVCVQPPHNF